MKKNIKWVPEQHFSNMELIFGPIKYNNNKKK